MGQTAPKRMVGGTITCGGERPDSGRIREYELLWNSTDGLDVLVNDELLVDNWDAAIIPEWAEILGDRFYWGCSDGTGIGSGYWKVEFEVLGGEGLPGDLNGDGFVGDDDLDIVRANWGQGTPPVPCRNRVYFCYW